MSRYSVHPTEQQFRDWDKEQRELRTQYWAVLYELRTEHRNLYPNFPDSSAPRLDYWVNEKYGFQMGTDGQGCYTGSYTVTDPKKFLFLQIKYGLIG